MASTFRNKRNNPDGSTTLFFDGEPTEAEIWEVCRSLGTEYWGHSTDSNIVSPPGAKGPIIQQTNPGEVTIFPRPKSP
jgi:hypothetical protein